MHASIHVIFWTLVVLTTYFLLNRPISALEIAAIVTLVLVGAYIYWPTRKQKKNIQRKFVPKDEWFPRRPVDRRRVAKLLYDFDDDEP